MEDHTSKGAEANAISANTSQIVNWDWTRTVSLLEWKSRNGGANTNPISINGRSKEQQPGILSTNVRFKRKIRGKRIDIVVRTSLRILGNRILEGELQIRLLASAWLSMPWLGVSLSTNLIRPSDAPIFAAIWRLDLDRVKRLINYGEASIHDIIAGDGSTLLTVRFLSSNKFEQQQRSQPSLIAGFGGSPLYTGPRVSGEAGPISSMRSHSHVSPKGRL